MVAAWGQVLDLEPDLRLAVQSANTSDSAKVLVRGLVLADLVELSARYSAISMVSMKVNMSARKLVVPLEGG
jgi:hypothetical protein